MTHMKSVRGLASGSSVLPATELGSGNWHDRVPPRDRLRGTPAAPAVSGRHSAITRSLYSYASYKSWADKVRTSWDPGTPDDGEGR